VLENLLKNWAFFLQVLYSKISDIFLVFYVFGVKRCKKAKTASAALLAWQTPFYRSFLSVFLLFVLLFGE
jgi:hypothetical protein